MKVGLPSAIVASLVAMLASTGAGLAQDVPGGNARLRGVVFDSTTMQPLAGARVVVMGTAATGWTGDDGRFRLEDLPPGSRQVSFFHPRLQTLGVSAIPQRVNLADGITSEVTLAIPSNRSLLRAWCLAESQGSAYAPLAGVVRDTLTGVPLPRAGVVVYAANRSRGRPPAELVETKTDESGYYYFCNVPAGPVIVRARFAGSTGIAVPLQLQPGEPAELDLDVVLSSVGQLQGTVVDYGTGEPVAGATVRLVGTDVRVVTDQEGRFLLDSIPPGQQLVESAYLGYATRMDSVTVFSNEAVQVELKLTTEPIVIEGMVVTARGRIGAAMIDVGRRTDYLGPDKIQALLPRVRDMEDLLRQASFPSLSVREVNLLDSDGTTSRALCVEAVRMRRNDQACQMLTVILNGVPLPRAEDFLLTLDPQAVESVQFLSPMEATTRYGAQAGGGALVITTGLRR
jgi:hypothetical protein